MRKCRFKTAIVATGGISALLGLLVLAGWYTRNITVIQLHPSFVPMHYTTAIAFFISGTGLSLSVSRYRRPTVACGALTASIGLLTLVQYGFNVHFDLIELPFIPSSLPAQMAPNTAICFIFAGSALFLIGLHSITWRAQILGLLGSTVTILGTVALFGYLTGITYAYGWGSSTPMAVHTAIGFLFLGTGIMVAAWHSVIEERKTPRWLPYLILIGGVTTTMVLWQALHAEEQNQIERMTLLEMTSVKNEISARLESRILALLRLARHWEFEGRPGKEHWESDAGLYVSHYPGTQSVGWADPALRVRWVEPTQGNHAVVGIYMGFDERRRKAIQSARERHQPSLSPAIDLVQGGKGLLVFIPVSRRNDFNGMVYGAYRIQEMFDDILQNVASGYSISIMENGERIYSRSPTDNGSKAGWERETTIDHLYGSIWRIRVAPTPNLLEEMRTGLDEVVLIAGITLTGLLALAVHFAQTTRRQARQVVLSNRELANEIAERKEQEKSLRKTQAELVQAYAELNSAHELALQREKLASIGQMAAGVAHEINNPVGFINSNLNTLNKYVERLIEFGDAQAAVILDLQGEAATAGLLEKRKQLKIDRIVTDAGPLIKESLEGAERVRRIVQDMKSFARTDDEENGDVDLQKCLESNINLVWNELKYKATLRREYGEIPPFRCNAQHLSQVFVNLLVNAAHAIDKTGEITVRTWQAAGSVCISISDTGCGIPPANLKKIFEPFFTTKEPGKGTGLGLSIVYNMVKKHDGEITVESAPGRGTTFTVKIPAAAKPPPSGTPYLPGA